MPRAKGGFKTRRRRKKVLESTKGYYGSKSRLFRIATEAQDKALQYAYRDRKNKKREFRALWIIRVTAAAEARGVSYSRFMHGLKQAGVFLNRKMLSEVAIADPAAFDKLVELAKQNIAAAT